MNRRIAKEIHTARKSGDPVIFWTKGCPLKLYIRLQGVGLYEDQVHLLKLKFVWGPENEHVFPMQPPLVKFKTSIWHPNISTKGSICLDILKEDEWTTHYGLSAIVNSLQLLLLEPNCDSPFNNEAAAQYMEDMDAFKTSVGEFYKPGEKAEGILAKMEK